MVAGPPRVCGRWRLTASSPIGSCIRGVPARGQPPTPRTSGCTGQGLCVLHEPPHLVEYTRTLPVAPAPRAAPAAGTAAPLRSSRRGPPPPSAPSWPRSPGGCGRRRPPCPPTRGLRHRFPARRRAPGRSPPGVCGPDPGRRRPPPVQSPGPHPGDRPRPGAWRAGAGRGPALGRESPGHARPAPCGWLPSPGAWPGRRSGPRQSARHVARLCRQAARSGL